MTRTNKSTCFNRYPMLIVAGLLVLTAAGPVVGGNRVRDLARPLGEVTNKLVGRGVGYGAFLGVFLGVKGGG